MTDLEIQTVSGRFLGGIVLASKLFSDLAPRARHSLSQISVSTHFDKGSTIISELDYPSILSLERRGTPKTIFF